MTRAFTALILLLHWSQGTEGGDDVVQKPEVIWRPKNGSASLTCRHYKTASYYQMYWYRQRQGETMTLIVFTMTNSDPDFGDVDKKKFEAEKSDAESGSLKLNDLEPDDSAIYFCAVSEHSVGKTGEGCTKTFCAEKYNNGISQQVVVWDNL